MAEHVQPDIHTVVKNIYSACDNENRNSARVSKLIEYITPFMGDNMSDLMELKMALDPNDDDPDISSEEFYRVMADWTRKFNDRSNSFHNISVDQLGIPDDKVLPFVQSTPRASFGTKLKKGIIDAPLLNNQSFRENASGGGLERSYYEEQINELNYQNRKYSDELLHIKLQLISTEEQNEMLQIELDSHKKLLAHERETIEALQGERRDFEELRETSVNAQKQAEKAEKKLQNTEKEMQILRQEISKLERDKLQSEEKIGNMHKKMTEKVTLIIELETEMKVKDQDMAALEDVNNNLIQRLDEHKKMIYDYQESTRCMQVEKEKLQKILKERMKKPGKIVKAPVSSGEYMRYSLPPNATLKVPPTPPPLPPKPQQKQHTDQDEVPFVSSIKSDTFNFYNYGSPYARSKRRASISTLSPLAKTHNTTDTDTNRGHTQVRNKSEYSAFTKTTLNNSLTGDLSGSFCKDDHFKTPVKGDDSDSPCYSARAGASTPASAILTSPNVSAFSINDSSEDEITRMHISEFHNYSPRESLRSEMLKARTDEDEDEENGADSEYKRRISDLEYELKRHQLNEDRLELDKMKLENDVHLAKIKQLENANENIQEQVERFKTALEAMRLEKEKLERQNENQFAKLESEKSALEKSCGDLRKGREELESMLKSTRDETDEVRKSLEVMRIDFEKRMRAIGKERDEMEGLMKAAQAERDETLQRLNVLRGDIERVRSENESLKNSHNEILLEVKSIRREKEIVDSENKSLKDEKREISSENKSLRDKIEKVQADNEALKEEKFALRSENESLANEKVRILFEIETLRKSTTEAELINDFRIKNEALSDSVMKLTQEKQLLLQRNAELTEENETLNSSLKKQIDALNVRESAFEDENSGFQERVERVQKAYNDLKADLEHIKSNNLEEIKVLQRNIAELIDDRETLEGEKDASEKHRIELETENEYLKDRVYALESNLSNRNEELKKLEGQLRENEGVIEGLNKFSLEAGKKQKDKENAFINGEMMLRQVVEELEGKFNSISNEKAALEASKAVINAKLIDATDEVQKLKTENFNMGKELGVLNEALAASMKEIKQLQQRLKSGDDKSKRGVKHDKMQMKLEKNIERLDYLEEQLRSERAQNEKYKQEAQTKEQKYMADIKNASEELIENKRNLRRSSMTLLKTWRPRLEQIPSMEEILDLFDNGDSESKHLHMFEHPLAEKLNLLKSEVKIVGDFMESLSKTSLLDSPPITNSSIINSTNETRIQNKFLLRPPTLVLKPMSPDSPNLEINAPKYEKAPKSESGNMSPDSRADTIAKNTCIGAGDISVDTFNSPSTSMGDFSHEESISLYEEVDDDGILPLPIIKLDRVSEETEEMKFSEEELAERFTVCVTEFTNEKETIGERLEAHCRQIRETEMNLSAAVNGIRNTVKSAFPESTGNQGEIMIRNIISAVCRLCQLAEQFGAMKQESKRVQSFTTMITHTTNLYLKLELAKQNLCECTSLPNKRQQSLQRFSNSDSIPPSSPYLSRDIFCSIVMTGTVMVAMFCVFLFWCIGGDERLVSWEEIIRGFVTKEYRNGPPPI